MRQESQTITKRILSVMLAVLMVFSVITPATVLAAEIDHEDIAQTTQDMSPEEYALWKQAYLRNESRNSASSTYSLRGNNYYDSGYIRNDYVEAYINPEGHYTMGTVMGDPLNDSDNNRLLLFGHPGSTTTETLVRVDGYDYFFDNYVTNISFSGNGTECVVTAMISGVQVKQILNIITNPFTGMEDLISIRYEYKNTDTVSKQVGIRIMLDTMLGDNDGAPFRVNGQDVIKEREYSGAQLPQYWQCFDNLQNPSVTATGFFFFNEEEKPDKVQFAYWSSIRGASWNYTTHETTYVTADSAVAAYFNPRNLPAGATNSVVTYYGISGFSSGNTDLNGELGVRVTAPSTLSGSVNGGYLNNPFTVSAYVNNLGAEVINDVKAVLRINSTNELVLDYSQATTAYIGDLYGGAGTAVQWNIRAIPQNVSKFATYSIDFYSGNTLLKTMDLDVELTALAQESIYRRVSFSLNGADGEAPEDQIVRIGSRIVKPEDPVRPGYTFGGWYSNPECTGRAWFNIFNLYMGYTVSSDMTLYAKWIADVDTQKIEMGIDTFNFENISQDFHNAAWGDYTISGDYYDALLKDLSNAEKTRVIDLMYSEWGGSGFGMSAVLSLVKAGKLDTHFFQGNADRLYDLYKPLDSSIITNLINYYELIRITQRVRAARAVYDRQVETDNNKGIIDALNDSAYPVVLSFNLSENGKGISEHTVVAFGYEETEVGYNVKIWDPNFKDSFNTLYISGDYTESYFMSLYDSAPYSSFIKYALTVEDGDYDYKNIQQTLIAMGNANGEDAAAFALAGERMLELETSYDSFTITSSSGKQAVVENGVKVSGDLDISAADYINEMGASLRTQYFIFGSDTDVYTIVPAGEGENRTALTYGDAENGFFVAVTAAASGKITFYPDGKVVTEFDEATQQNISISTNNSSAPWYMQSAEGSSKGITISPVSDGIIISTADNTQLTVSARDDYNSVVFENYEFTAGTLVKLTTDADNPNIAILGNSTQVMGHSLVFLTTGGSPIPAQTNIPSGSTAVEPEDPTRDGFIFAGWYKTAACRDGEEWSFSTPIVSDTRIYAKWLVDNRYIHTVTFKAAGHDDQIFAVRDGDSLEYIPEVPAILCGTGVWDVTDFTNIRADIIVNAVYTAEHTFDEEHTETVPAKCTENGYIKMTCAVCGFEDIEILYSTGHGETAYSEGTAATCTQDGYTGGNQCLICGAWLDGHDVIPASHTDADGDAVCDVCGETEIVVVTNYGKLGTNIIYILYSDGTLMIIGTGSMFEYTASTTPFAGNETIVKIIIEEGVTNITNEVFVNCANLESVMIPVSLTAIGAGAFDGCTSLADIYYAGNEDQWNAVNNSAYLNGATIHFGVCLHRNTEVVAGVEPTCQEDGYTEGLRCTYCGEWVEGHEIIPGGGHVIVTVEGYAATCTEDGLTDGKHCERCEAIIEEQKIIPATGHINTTVYDEEPATCGQDGMTAGEYCNDCEKWITEREIIPAPEHEEVFSDYREPTCEEPGSTGGTHCAICGMILEEPEEIPALGHTEVFDEGVEPTCEEPGVTPGTYCAECEKWLEGHEDIPALEHEEEYVEAQEPTCSEYGYTEGIFCINCEQWLEGHEEIEMLEHEIVIEEGYEPTCTEPGLTDGEYCNVCGEVLTPQEEIEPLGHTEEYVPEEEATCMDEGYTEGIYCPDCETWLEGHEIIPTTDHEEEVIEGYEATCTEPGLTDGIICAICEEVLEEQEEIDPLGHEEEIEEGIEPTCTEPGLTEGEFCSVCGEILVEQEEIDPLGHVEEIEEGVEPTCTEPGLTEGEYCSVCGEVLVEQEEIEPLGHKLVTLKAKAATCTKTGLTAGKKCSVCGKITVAQKKVAKKGHTEVTIKAKAATCKKTGLTAGKKCSVCGKVTVAQKTVAKKAHSYKTTTTKATLTKNGKQVTKCKNCGYTSKTTVVYYPKTIKLSTTEYKYSGGVKAPSVSVKDAKGKTLKRDVDYTVKYASGRKNPGKYTVTVTFIGKYSGTKKLVFTIKPAAPKITSLTSTKKGSATLKWSNVTGESGYEVYFSTNKSSGYKKLATYDVNKVTATKNKLTSKKTYYFKVRSFKKTSSGTVYSAWSSVKSVKIK